MVEFRGLKKSFGATTVISSLNLSVKAGEFVAVVGPSGCGKSTLLRLLAGLETCDGGEIFIDDRNVSQLAPGDRDIGMVFQSYALYPHLNVQQNIAFPLKMQKLPASEIEERLRETAQMLDLADLMERKPAQLSGGQKQRVAMARAIVKRPRVLLFDEPLSNLDAQLRTRVRSEIAQLHRRLKATVIYVTHDQIEAMTLADRVAILNKGNLEQFASPLELYDKPATAFVASFIGTPPMNLLPASEAGSFPRPPNAATVGFRPERVSREAAPESLALGDAATVTLLERLGSSTHIHALVGKTPITVVAKDAQLPFIGEKIQLHLKPESAYYFQQSGHRI